MPAARVITSATHPLLVAVLAVQQQVRRHLWFQGVGSYLTLVVSCVILLGIVDFSVRFEDPWMRFASTSLVLTAAVVGGVKFLLPAASYAPTPIDTASRIEHHAPHLRNRLSTALAFLEPSKQSGEVSSPALRHAVIAETAEIVDEIRGDASTSRRNSMIACALLATAGIICVLDFQTSCLALMRLLIPWKQADWPRLHVLEFEDPPQQVAHGQDLVLRVVDRNGRLPRQVSIQYRFASDGPSQLHNEMLDVETSRARFRLENITQAVHFRALGGDDNTMEWFTARVVDPPEIESYLARLHPPTYTGWTVHQTDQRIRALAGTRIELGAYSNKPLMNVALRAAAHDLPFDIWTHLDDDRRVFVVPANSELPWVVKQTGTFWFELTDQTEIRGGEQTQFVIQAIPDRPPSVTVANPTTDLYVTAMARLPIRATIKEDLAIRDVYFQYNRSDSNGDPTVVFWHRGSSQVSTTAARQSFASLESGRSASDVRTLSREWDLGSLRGLAPGTKLTGIVVATDYQPQRGQSAPIQLTVISPSELEQQIRRQRSEILERLGKVVHTQHQLHTQVEDLKIAAGRSKDPSGRIDELHAIELRQRQIGTWLSGENGSVVQRIETILEQLRVNRIDQPTTKHNMEGWHETITKITRENLPTIRIALVTALKTARDTTNNPELVRLLDQVGQQQQAVLRRLAPIQNTFSQRQTYLKLSLQLRMLLDQQIELQQDTLQLEQSLLGNSDAALSELERERLDHLAKHQMDLAHRYQRLLVQMQQTRDGSANSDRVQSATLAEALRVARQYAVETLFSESADALRQNQLGRASDRQQLAVERVESVVEILRQERSQPLAHDSRRLQQSAQQLDWLLEQQQQIRERLVDTPDADLAMLSNSQRALTDRARILGQRLEHLGIKPSGSTVTSAVEKMSVLYRALEQAEATAANGAAEEAVNLLERARQQLQGTQERLVRERSNNWAQELQRLLQESHQRQSLILEKTRPLATFYARQPSWSPQQATQLAALVQTQRRLAADTGVKRSSFPAVFVARLDAISRQMLRVAQQLTPVESDCQIQESEDVQEKILIALIEMVDALRQQATPRETPSRPTAPGSRPDSNQADPNRIRSQLWLLKSWQQNLYLQTAVLETRRQQSGKLTSAESQQLKELAANQKRLAELTTMLSQQDLTAPEHSTSDSLENLPQPADSPQPERPSRRDPLP